MAKDSESMFVESLSHLSRMDVHDKPKIKFRARSDSGPSYDRS